MLGIGQIGLGSIAGAHRAGYALAGTPVVAGFDPSEQARRRFAAEMPGAKVCQSVEGLLADPRVELIDLATPHHREARVPVIEKIARSGKPVLIQKPMAISYADALEIVQMLESAGVVGMVNQNMCFTPIGLHLPRLVVDLGAIGKPILAHVELRMNFDPSAEHWFGKDLRWQTIGHTVHQIALLHLVFGPPVSVYAVCGNDPGMKGVRHDGFGHMILSYAGGLRVVLLSTSTYYGDTHYGYGGEAMWFQGDKALIDWHADGYRLTPSTLRTNADPAAQPALVPTPGKWFPDAFGMVMSHFQQAIQARKMPLCSVQDNLYVMAVVEAVYQSHASGQAVSLKSLMGSRWQDNYGPGWSRGFNQWVAPKLSRSEIPT